MEQLFSTVVESYSLIGQRLQAWVLSVLWCLHSAWHVAGCFSVQGGLTFPVQF